MCIRCGREDATTALDYCVACAIVARVEVADGLRQLEVYLAAWAAFDWWARDQGVSEP